jgi:hypothetical protein
VRVEMRSSDLKECRVVISQRCIERGFWDKIRREAIDQVVSTRLLDYLAKVLAGRLVPDFVRLTSSLP